MVRREEERFRQTLQRGEDLLDERARRRRRLAASDAFFLHDTLGFPIDLTREIADERGRAGRPRGLRRADGRAAHTGARRAQGRGRRGRARRSSSTASCSTSTAPPTSPAARSTRPKGAKVPALLVGGERVGAADDRRRGRRHPRPHAVLRGVRWPGRRHRHDHRRATARRVRVDRHAVRDRRVSSLHRGTVERGRAGRGRRGRRRDRRPAPRRDPPQPHRDPHPALGAARGARHRT